MACKENEISYAVYFVGYKQDKKDFSYMFSIVNLDFLSTDRFKRELDAFRINLNYERVDVVLCQMYSKE